MRLKIHHLRVALIAANLILAGGAAAYAFTKYHGLTEKKRDSVKILDPKTLVPTGGGTPQTKVDKLMIVAERLIPRKPPDLIERGPDDEAKDTQIADEEAKKGKELEPGPLGDHWEYAFYILLEDPMNNLVILRKKEAAGAQPGVAAAASKQGGARPRPTLRPSRVNLNQRKGAGAVQPAGDSLTFTVGQRWYKNDAVDPVVDIYIHSADSKQLVYWIPEAPQKMYALPRAHHSLIYEEPEKGLRPVPPPEGGEEEARPKSHFVLRPDGWEDKKEEEYQAMLKGEPAGPNMKLTGPQELEKDEKGGKASSPSSKKPVPSFGKAQEPRKTFTDEEKDQLREVMKSPKMSDKDRAELRKALMGNKKK